MKRRLSIAMLLALCAALMIAPTVSAAPGAGVYELFFTLQGSSTPITEVTGGSFYEVHAHVEDASGNDATKGTILLQACLHPNGGLLASSNCVQGGIGRWTTIVRAGVDETGSLTALRSTPSTIVTTQTQGYRYKYTGQGSGIANSYSPNADITVNVPV